jgi:RNA polymerase sigma-70 factor (ECF subfamily)
MPHSRETGEFSAAFTTTQWSEVLEAQQIDPERARAALENLCGRYWYPLYAFVRRRGHSPHEAEDLTQSFFAHLLAREGLNTVDRNKGLFRTFLLSSLAYFLNDQRDRQQAVKRGGGRQIVSWDALTAEELYQHEPAEGLTPEKLFERRWALTLIEQALNRLRLEYQAGGKKELFLQLECCLTGGVSAGFYEETAKRLGMNEGAVRVALHRLRRRLGELLRSEIAHTVTSPEQVDEEIRYLFTAIRQ